MTIQRPMAPQWLVNNFKSWEVWKAPGFNANVYYHDSFHGEGGMRTWWWSDIREDTLIDPCCESQTYSEVKTSVHAGGDIYTSVVLLERDGFGSENEIDYEQLPYNWFFL